MKVVDNEGDYLTIEHLWPQTVSEDIPEHHHETINGNSDRLANLALITIEDNAGNENDPYEEEESCLQRVQVRDTQRHLRE